MSEVDNWAIEALRKMGYTPEQAVNIAVERLSAYNFHEDMIKDVQSELEDLNGIGWEAIYRIVKDEDLVANSSKNFDFTNKAHAFWFLSSLID
jgi:hypothetical protein